MGKDLRYIQELKVHERKKHSPYHLESTPKQPPKGFDQIVSS